MGITAEYEWASGRMEEWESELADLATNWVSMSSLSEGANLTTARTLPDEVADHSGSPLTSTEAKIGDNVVLTSGSTAPTPSRSPEDVAAFVASLKAAQCGDGGASGDGDDGGGDGGGGGIEPPNTGG